MKVLDVLRTEKKYPMRYETARNLMHRLGMIMEPDPYMKEPEGYRVRSLYFDSFTNRDYHEKEAGLECRKKIRLRTYGDDGIIKLEWKQKQGEVQRKRSMSVSRQEAVELSRGNYRVLMEREEELAGEFYGLMMTEVYRPRCLVEYRRAALVEEINDIRITFDSDLRIHEGCFDLFDLKRNHCYPVWEPGRVTMEVKYNGFLFPYIKDILMPYTLTQEAASKYCAGRKYGLGGRTT